MLSEVLPLAPQPEAGGGVGMDAAEGMAECLALQTILLSFALSPRGGRGRGRRRQPRYRDEPGVGKLLAPQSLKQP